MWMQFSMIQKTPIERNPKHVEYMCIRNKDSATRGHSRLATLEDNGATCFFFFMMHFLACATSNLERLENMVPTGFSIIIGFMYKICFEKAEYF